MLKTLKAVKNEKEKEVYLLKTCSATGYESGNWLYEKKNVYRVVATSRNKACDIAFDFLVSNRLVDMSDLIFIGFTTEKTGVSFAYNW